MARGGARPGSGRRPGAANKVSRAAREAALKTGVSPLEFLLGVMRGKDDLSVRLDAAKAAAPYVHARLASVEVGGPDGGPVPFQVISGVPRADD